MSFPLVFLLFHPLVTTPCLLLRSLWWWWRHRDAPSRGHPGVRALSSYLDQRGVSHPLENDSVSCAGSRWALSHGLLCLSVPIAAIEVLRLCKLTWWITGDGYSFCYFLSCSKYLSYMRYLLMHTLHRCFSKLYWKKLLSLNITLSSLNRVYLCVGWLERPHEVFMHRLFVHLCLLEFMFACVAWRTLSAHNK